jgi:hypothetical protein
MNGDATQQGLKINGPDFVHSTDLTFGEDRFLFNSNMSLI